MKTEDVTAAIIAAANQVGVHIHDLDRLHQQVHASWKRTVVAEAVLRTRGYGDYEIDPRELSHRAWLGRWVAPCDPSYAAQVDQREGNHPDARPGLTSDRPLPRHPRAHGLRPSSRR